jgi:hypothetical protein
MKVYHGSFLKIESIDLKKCEPHKDFGRGFYVTNILSQAEYWAEKMGERHHSVGVITAFDFAETAFTNGIYKVLRFDDYSVEWLDFVVMNRNKKLPVPAHDFDIVEGPVADDRISRRITSYLAGKITKEKFLEELQHHQKTHQICFCTPKSLTMLDSFDENFFIELENIGESLLEALMLDRNIDEATAADIFYTADTFAQLADSNTALYLKPWTEIYQLLLQELNK